MSEDLLKTTQAARLLGVGPTAVKRWADEGLLPCLKTAGGHRRIRRADAESFLKGGPAPAPGNPPLPSPAAPPETARWMDALSKEDSPYLLEGMLLAERGRKGSWAGVADLLGSVLEEVGVRWNRGEWSVLQEHLASERLVRALVRASESIPLPLRAPRALLSVPEGEDHTLGLSLLELCLRESGWTPLWAGRRTPAGELVSLVRQGKVEMVAASASVHSKSAEVLSRWLGVVAPACRKAGVRLVLGGRGAWPEKPAHGVRLNDFRRFKDLLKSSASQ